MKLQKMFLIYKGCFPYNQILTFIFPWNFTKENSQRQFFLVHIFILFVFHPRLFFYRENNSNSLLFFPLKIQIF